MSNGEVCCILGVCCPPARAREEFVTHLVQDTGCDIEYAKKMVDWTLDRFTLAPKSFEPVVHELTRMAKSHQHE